MACFFVRLPAVAVGASYFALLYFGNDALQGDALARRLTNIEVLVRGGVVVELQHNRVTLAAVHAVVSLQVLKQPRPDAPAHRIGVFPSAGFYLGLVGLVVPLLR